MGTPETRSSFSFQLLENLLFNLEFGGASGVKGGVRALAVDAEERCRGAASGYRFVVTALRAGSVGSAASVLGVCMVLRTEGTGVVLLLAGSKVVPQAEASGAMCSGCGGSQDGNPARTRE